MLFFVVAVLSYAYAMLCCAVLNCAVPFLAVLSVCVFFSVFSLKSVSVSVYVFVCVLFFFFSNARREKTTLMARSI